MGERQTYCVNCLMRVHGKAGGRLRGRDIAWHAHCPRCAALVADQMEPVLSIERPRGAVLEIRRCRWCGAERTCPAGWATRCHVCRDERTVGALASVATLVDALAQYEQPGWTVIAGDVLGLPWTARQYEPKSHGTWGRHDPCGRIQVMSRSRDECAACPPEPDSRTHRARADEAHLLYLVRYQDFVKFGRGYRSRVHHHLRAGATPVQVLTARHADVHLAELELKRRHINDVLRGVTDVPESFGAGTEVLPLDLKPDLAAFLPHGEDVTHRFGPRRT